MLYCDAALYRVQRWIESLDPHLRSPLILARLTGLSSGTLTRFLRPGGVGNVTLDTLRRLEQHVPADFMPLRMQAEITRDDEPANAA
jgi:hypothetical protein